MKAYVITSGTVFALVFAAHIWRAVAEWAALVKNPVFLLTSNHGVATPVGRGRGR